MVALIAEQMQLFLPHFILVTNGIHYRQTAYLLLKECDYEDRFCIETTV